MIIRRILVVDNEQYIREVTQICLETVAGWQVITAGSGDLLHESARQTQLKVDNARK